MLYRDWAFSAAATNAMCPAIQNGKNKITLIVGGDHAARLEYFLREKFGDRLKLSFRNVMTGEKQADAEAAKALFPPKAHCDLPSHAGPLTIDVNRSKAVGTAVH